MFGTVLSRGGRRETVGWLSADVLGVAAARADAAFSFFVLHTLSRYRYRFPRETRGAKWVAV